ncbi:extracellular solute-binding protein [Paenibacillus sp. J5C_2022]|uniref:extracellular solute-binding protein n=1 Tax=Paenibacillus sp. J5C2022 TaxID=2977129 RepID=UPI0021D2A9CD|nr:extracellular solute-binding protein [Paenibacillus sp. J5C2022]MCU6709931.1 extracellular solute-binding protein [Paenibacillus sp. J5C2022]
MKMNHKLFRLVWVFSLSAIIIAGCSGNGNGHVKQSGTAAPGNDDKKTATKRQTFTMSIWDIEKSFQNRENDELLKKVEQDFNITIKPVNVTWSDYNEKFNLWATSGELPDLFVTDLTLSTTYNTWVQQNIIRPLPDDLSPYPNIEKLLKQPDLAPLQKDGKFYFVPRQSKLTADDFALERGFIVRKDWMEKLGFKTPTTFEEYKALFKAFAQMDPDGNNKDDTVGLTTNHVPLLQSLFLGSVPELTESYSWLQEDGKWIPSFVSKNMIDGIVQFRQLYEEGALDKDFAILKTGDGGDKFAQGLAGAINMQMTDAMMKGLKDKWMKYGHEQEFEDSIILLPIWQHMDGNNYRNYSASAYSGLFFSSKVDDEKMAAILKLIDFAISTPGERLFNYGIEGKDYTIENDKIVLTREKDSATGTLKPLNQLYPSVDTLSFAFKSFGTVQFPMDIRIADKGEKLVKMHDEMYDYMINKFKAPDINWEVLYLSTPAKDKLKNVKYWDDIVRIVLDNEEPDKLWEQVVKGYEAKGLNQAITEVNEMKK